MINFKKNKELMVIGLIGLGLYAQNCQVNLANNTTILITLFFLLMEDERIDKLEQIESLEHCRYPSPRSHSPQGCCEPQCCFR